MSADPQIFASRFWAKVDVLGPDECWPWLAGRDKDGYGRIKRYGKTERAHRIAMRLSGKVLEDDDIARHTCDNPPCCNPAHAVAGTTADNVEDMYNRGRAPDRRGERQGNSKLTEQQVVEIRASEESQRALASRYGVTQSNICMIRAGRTWSCLPV